jgi:septal ring factor EnvC (AmiA/AmiB activator)
MTNRKLLHLLAICVGGMLLSGCVMAEKYKAEKARSLNFQRLLAQEEKRTGELDAELRRVKQENSELMSRNDEMANEVQAARSELDRVREEVAMREAERQRRQARTELRDTDSIPRAAPTATSIAESIVADAGSPRYHVVVSGDTLFRLGRQYGVSVNQIREWNGLTDNLIVVDHMLIVGYE